MGSGYKSFSSASVLTAADLNNYCQSQSVMYFATTTARDTAITSPQRGMNCYIGSSDGSEGLYQWNGTKWVQVSQPYAVSSYTPALTASTTNPTLGTGSSAYGSYVKIGAWVFGSGVIIFGSSGVSAGSGDYFISLPVSIGGGSSLMGTSYLVDTAPSYAWRTAVLESAGTNKSYLNMGASARATHSNPWTWAANDQIHINFSYQVAP